MHIFIYKHIYFSEVTVIINKLGKNIYMVKILRKSGMGRNVLNLIKSIYKKSIANTILNGEILNTFLLRSGTSLECPPSTLFVNSVFGI